MSEPEPDSNIPAVEGMEEDPMDESEEGMPELVDVSDVDEEEIEVAQELMAVDSDSSPPTPAPQPQNNSNTIPPPQQPAVEAGHDASLPGIRQVFEEALRNGAVGRDAPVTISMDFTFQLPLVPAPPPHPTGAQPPNTNNTTPITISPSDFGIPAPSPPNAANNEQQRQNPTNLLHALFGLLGAQGGAPREDPERARTIVRGLEAVSESMVKRLVSAEEGTCAVCMESLEDEAMFGQEAPAETTSTTSNEATSSTNSTAEAASSSTDTTPSEPLPRIVALPCAHVFHTACLTPWLARQTTCPNCRFDLDPDSLTLSSPPPQAAHGLGPQFLAQLFANGAVRHVHGGEDDGFDTFVMAQRRQPTNETTGFGDALARAAAGAPPTPVSVRRPAPALESLPTPMLERALLHMPVALRPPVEAVLARRRAASLVQRGEGAPGALGPQAAPATATASGSTTTTTAPPIPVSVPVSTPSASTSNLPTGMFANTLMSGPGTLSPAAQALLTAHRTRLQAQAQINNQEAAEHPAIIDAEGLRERAREQREEEESRIREFNSFRQLGQAAQSGDGNAFLEVLRARDRELGEEMARARAQSATTAAPGAFTPSAPTSTPPAPTAPTASAAPTQPQGEGAGPTQPGRGPLLSVFARQFAEILQREIGEGLRTHLDHQDQQTAPAHTHATPATSGTSTAQPATPAPPTPAANAQPAPTPTAHPHIQSRTSIHIFPFTPGHAPPPPPPGFSFVDFIVPGDFPMPTGSGIHNHAGGTGTDGNTGGGGGMDIDGLDAEGRQVLGDLGDMFGRLARAFEQDVANQQRRQQGQGGSTTPAGEPPVPTPTPTTASTAPPSTPTTASTAPASTPSSAPPITPSSAPATVPAPTTTETVEPAAHLAPDGTLALTSDTQAARAEQLQPRRTDSPARARGNRVVSGSVPSVARVNPSGASTPVRASSSADSGTPVAPTSGEASGSGSEASGARARTLSVRDDQPPMAALPFPFAVPIPVPTTARAEGQPLPVSQLFHVVPPPVHTIPARTPVPPQAQIPAQPQPAPPQTQQQPMPQTQPQVPGAQPQQQNRTGFHFTPLTGPGGRTLGGIFTFAPGQPAPPFGPAPPPGHILPTGPVPERTDGRGIPRFLQDMMDGIMAGGESEAGGVSVRPVAPLPRRARSVPAGGPQPQEGSQAQAQAAPRPTVPQARPTPQVRPRRKWVVPAAPGPTLRQKVEASERARGLRCDAPGCVFAPSDEKPEGAEGGELKGVEGCGHVFHAECRGERCVVCEAQEGSVKEGKRKREVVDV